jgi:hypothetical protein
MTMNGLDPRFRRSLYWLLPLALVAVVIGFETNWAREMRHVMPQDGPVAPPTLSTAVLPDYSAPAGRPAAPEMVSRTLFNPTRRPAPTLATEAGQPKMQRGQFALSGTLLLDGKSTVFLRETAGGKSRRVVQGDVVNGMQVAVVKPDRVTLKLGDETEELVLAVAKNPRPTPMPVAVAAPGGAVPAGVPPAGPGMAGQTPPVDAAATLAERRRAAQQAQAAANQGGAATPVAQPVATPAAASATPSDPRWQDVYQRYQQRASQAPPQK